MTARINLASRLALGLVLLATGFGIQQSALAKDDPLHAWANGDDPAKLEKWVDTRLAAEKSFLDKLLAVNGNRTIENTLQPYDLAQNQLALASNEAYMMFALGRTAALRDKAQALNEKVASAATALSLNRKVYDALAAVPQPTNDAATKYYLERTLLEYRLAGVDRDDATREKLRALQDKITSLSLVFGRNVQDGTITIHATKAELDGLPADYIARHKPDADGNYALTTDQPDASPVLAFAANADLRMRMYLAYNNRAYPVNRQVLLDLLAARQELAALLGYQNYADLATADQMIGKTANVRKLFDDVDNAARDTMQKEYAQLLAFSKKRDSAKQSISSADASYWMEQFRRAKFDFDSQSVRPYFAYDQVQAGILDSAGKIFHVKFNEVKNLTLWHPSVTAYDVIDRGHKVGRIYLDMHPREGKDKWFSSAPVVPGIVGKQIPEGILICNFSGGVAGDPGLMLQSEVVTYFHEFGHLMHHILGSQQRWSGQGGFNVEGDFVEAPSQMLEEFFSNYKVLATFAHHYQTGEVLPVSVMDKMNAAEAFGRGTAWVRQLFYGSLSLNLHDRPVAEVDLDGQLRQLSDRYFPYGFVEGNRMYASFTHLVGYSSNYYTYILDKVIALDFYSQFNQDDPLSDAISAKYRKAVIDAGATKPAMQLATDFLGRPYNMDAFKAWLGVEFKK